MEQPNKISFLHLQLFGNLHPHNAKVPAARSVFINQKLIMHTLPARNERMQRGAQVRARNDDRKSRSASRGLYWSVPFNLRDKIEKWGFKSRTISQIVNNFADRLDGEGAGVRLRRRRLARRNNHVGAKSAKFRGEAALRVYLKI